MIGVSNSTQANTGDSVGLTCTVFYRRDMNLSNIVWSKDGQQVFSNSSSITLQERDEMEGERFFRHSTLYFCDLVVSDSGNYTCSVSNGTLTKNEHVELSVKETAQIIGEVISAIK